MNDEIKSRHKFPIVKTIGGHEYVVDLIRDEKTLDDAFSLRYQVFNVELQEGLRASEKTQRDIDEFDEHCDHIAVIDKTANKLIATYRLLPFARAKKTNGFYAETEFDLTELYQKLSNSAEIGRSCVHPDYRNGRAISLLWYGISNYLITNDINILFGCTSLDKGASAEDASKIYQLIKKLNANCDDTLNISPLKSHLVEGFNPNFTISSDEVTPLRRQLPSIFRGYMSLDVKYCGHPAYDAEFDVIDFFTVFDYSAISKMAKRFKP